MHFYNHIMVMEIMASIIKLISITLRVAVRSNYWAPIRIWHLDLRFALMGIFIIQIWMGCFKWT